MQGLLRILSLFCIKFNNLIQEHECLVLFIRTLKSPCCFFECIKAKISPDIHVPAKLF